MRDIFIEFLSKNGIRFHHSISYDNSGDKEVLQSESHLMFEVMLLISGSIEYLIEGQHYKISPMDIIVIPPNKIHSINTKNSTPYERMVLHFSPSLVPDFSDIDLLASLTETSTVAHIIPQKLVAKSNIISLIQECRRHCVEKNEYIDLRLTITILHIVESLNLLIREIKLMEKENTIQPIKINKISYACTQYINKNLHKNITARDLAKELNISQSHIQNTFKKEIGISLYEYIINQKMQAARSMLIQGTPPQIVAQNLGYNYYATFYHNYVKKFNTSPNSLAHFHTIRIENTEVDD